MSATLEATRYTNFVNGQESKGREAATFELVNPTTGKLFGQFIEFSAGDIDDAVRAAHAAFEGPWRTLSPTRRGRLMMRWGDLITEHAEQIATMETEQNGKLIAEMRTQARIVQDWLYYFGGLADKIEGRVVPLDRTSVLNYTVQRAARRRRGHRAVEFADIPHDHDGRARRWRRATPSSSSPPR